MELYILYFEAETGKNMEIRPESGRFFKMRFGKTWQPGKRAGKEFPDETYRVEKSVFSGKKPFRLPEDVI